MKTKNIKNKVGQFYDWYIKGEYHCDHCPYSWEEWSYEGDGDCGCYIKGEIQETCRLMPPFKNIIGNIRKKKSDYSLNHSWDGFAEFCREQDQKENFLREKINEHFFVKNQFYVKDPDGNYILANSEDYSVEIAIRRAAADILHSYDDTFCPVIHKSLRQKWKELIKENMEYVLKKFRPYFSK